MTAIAPHLTAFFQQRLPVERNVSSHTSDSYAYAFKLFLEYASTRHKIRPSKLEIEHLDAPAVVSFLDHLETARANSRFSSGRSSVSRRWSPAAWCSAGRIRGSLSDAPLPR